MNKTSGAIVVVIGITVGLAIVLPIVLILPSEKQNLVVVKASEGTIVGKVVPEAGIFWGVPFSQPPVGNLRWRKPRDPLSYGESYWNATFKRPGCDQICNQPVPEYSCPHKTNEDCLYLNVWVPKRLLKGTQAKEPINEQHYEIDPNYLPTGTRSPLPVMIWFHGGNFLNGAGSSTLYDGRFMAQKGDVIVVTTNYRMGHLGFLVQGKDGSEERKGNFGFWDQVKAMQWVNKNIAMFGGNPSQVTLFGQSAGAESIGIHLTSHVSGHLFQKAIMHSNPFGLPFRLMDDAKKFGDRFSNEAGCEPDDMDCLRSKSVQELELAFNSTKGINPELITILFQPWGPVIDGDVVPDQPLKLFIQNKVQQKPMITGSTVDETTIYIAEVFPEALNSTAYNWACKLIFRGDYEEVIKMYPPECEDSDLECDNRDRLSQLGTEYLFECPQRRSINSTTVQKWLYSFNQTWSFFKVWEEPQCFDKVCHAADLAYIFGIESLTVFDYTPEERQLSERLIQYWSNFAHHSDPNDVKNNDLTEWPMFEWKASEQEYKALELKGANDIVLVNPSEKFCNFWDELDVYAEHF